MEITEVSRSLQLLLQPVGLPQSPIALWAAQVVRAFLEEMQPLRDRLQRVVAEVRARRVMV